MRWMASCTLALAALMTCAMAQTAPQDQIGHKSDPNADEKKTLLLKDFKPGDRRGARQDLFVKYQDRALFGTDGVTQEMYRNNFRWLETADEYFDCWGAPSQGRFEISGLALPDQILEKIRHKNAEKLFNQFRPDSGAKSTREAQ